MKQKHIQIALTCLMTAVVLSRCGPATEITGSWRNSNINAGSIHNVMVTALTSNTRARQTVENDLAAALLANGIQVVKSMDILPPTFTAGKEPEKEELLNKINGTNVDAILTVALLRKETETRYEPGTYGYEPLPRFGYYGRFWGYYNTWYPTIYSPGYYAEDKVYFMETNLYDANTEELLWSAQSETYNPSNLSSFSKDFAAVVLKRMEEENVIAK